MPIRPENRGRYPPEWPEIRARILRRADHRCERCRVANYALGGRTRDGRFCPALPLGERRLRLEWPVPGSWAWCEAPATEPLKIIRIVLTIAHLDHQPENCDPDNLAAWCQRCHVTYDAQHHAATARRTRRQRLAIAELFACPPESNEFEWVHSAPANKLRGPITGAPIDPGVVLGTLRGP